MVRQENPRKIKQKSIIRWIGLALLLHGELALVLGVILYFTAPRQAELDALRREAVARNEPISVSTVDEDIARKIIADLEKQEEKAKAAEVAKETESTRAPGQVVDLARPRDQRRPEDARFAAEYDSWVEKETKKYGKFYPDAQQRHQGLRDEGKRSSQLITPSPAKTHGSPGALAMRMPGTPTLDESRRRSNVGTASQSQPSSSEENLPSDPEGAFAPSREGSRPRAERATVPRGEAGGQPGQLGLVPSEAQIAQALGSGTQDRLVDVDEGAETALRAKNWKFATFFNRVKTQVRDHWKPAEEYARRDPTGRIYGSEDRYTLLQVKLKPDGWLSDVSLVHTSGLEFLDQIAMDAFRGAQPFLNPPRELVEAEHGHLSFTFGFFFEVSGSPRMKVFRYKSM
jgi:outer membrane biosynthesis protein TonB